MAFISCFGNAEVLKVLLLCLTPSHFLGFHLGRYLAVVSRGGRNLWCWGLRCRPRDGGTSGRWAMHLAEVKVSDCTASGVIRFTNCWIHLVCTYFRAVNSPRVNSGHNFLVSRGGNKMMKCIIEFRTRTLFSLEIFIQGLAPRVLFFLVLS